MVSTPSSGTVVRMLGVIVLVAVLVPFVVFTVPQVVGAEHSYVVVSGSMTPAIGVGETVIVDKVSPTAIHEGDVITFISGEQATIEGGQAGENLVTHRVVDVVQTKDGPKFKTKGDANEDPDSGFVRADAVVGRVMFSIPYIGHVIAFAGTQLGLILLVAIPLGLLVLGEIYDLAVAARNTRRRANETADAEPTAAADGSAVESDIASNTNTNEPMTENTPPAGFDPGVSVTENGAPVDTHDSRAEPTDPTTSSESEGMDDA